MTLPHTTQSKPTAPATPPEPPLHGLAQLFGSGQPVQPPIRATLFGQARFEQHGRSLAQTHEVLSGRQRGGPFFPRLEDNIRMLRQARSLIERQAREGQYLSPAAHWLLDNAALIDEQLHAIRRGLPLGFFRLLPRLRDEPLAGLPRVYGVAWAWVAHTDSGLDRSLLQAYLGAYQSERALTLAELWALPTTLRVVLVENLRRLAERAAAQQVARDVAHHWLDLPPGQHRLDELQQLAEHLRERGVLDSLLLPLEQRQNELLADEAQALRGWLVTQLPEAARTLERQQAEATEDQQSIRNAITTLRQIGRIDWRTLLARTCPVMQMLQQVPVHAAEREDAQDQTLHAVERLARQSGRSEAEVARALLRLTAEHSDTSTVGAAPRHWWGGPGEPVLRETLGLPSRWWPRPCSPAARQLATAAYLLALATTTVLGVSWLLQHHADPAAGAGWIALAALLLLAPASEAVVAVTNRLISESAAPARLPRLALADGIPAEHQVLVVVPCMLTSTTDIQALVDQLEQHHLANPEPHAQLALLSDWADATTPDTPHDQPLLAAAMAALDALNRRYPPPAIGAPLRFLLLHRGRSWSDTEQRHIGWERKRGKLEALAQHLIEPGHRPFMDLGALSHTLPDTRYIVTLDSDTDMPPGRLRELVGVAAHPLNLPRVDMGTRRVVAGYGILQPRVVTPLPSPHTLTRFHQLFSGQCGIDPYSAASSELYQDVFGEGTFTGKGLLNVQALRWTLQDRLPEGQVLSHDLLEGALARCAGVSDITLVEDAPVHADVAASRIHRWTRGDWQLLPFLWGRHRLPLMGINRWKMVDNLRRALVAPLSLALLLLCLATGVLPVGWALLVVAVAYGAGPLLGAVAGLAPSRDDIALGLFFRQAGGDLLRAMGLGAWHMAQLLQQALMYGDAIGRALYRQAVSRRHLLQWTTAAAAQAAASTSLPRLVQQHRRVPLAALGLGLGLGLADAAGAPVAWPAAGGLLLLWAASPLWTWWMSKPLRRPVTERCSPADSEYLHGLARETWRYYERHVTADDQHLPPDNVQLLPHPMVAHRTSPTNIGMYLLASSCAHALGFIGTAELAERLSLTLATLERLPRHLGHFYNWYDTTTGAVLPPAYVSTVDSGNCSGHLLAVAQACRAVLGQPEGASPALRQALDASQQRLKALQTVLAASPGLQTLAGLVTGPAAWPADGDQAAWLALREQVQQARHELDALHPAQTEAQDAGTWWLLHDHLATLGSAVDDQLADHGAVRSRLTDLAERLRALALEPQFAPLYDRQRKLLHIGLRVDTGVLDDNHYDLLASESRLTSLLAIAKGELPVVHWAALGRPFFAQGQAVGLKSWSGSMFEYLMPSLVLDEPVGSVLYQITRTAVAEQQHEALAHHTPWGISESAIAGQDHTLAYQYGPQGVARLALRRTPAEERVLAPYASAMATLVAPSAAVANLRALQALGARGAMGFMEALDYTPTRQIAGSRFVPVNTFMAHHQAMALVAFTDVLCDGAPRRWTMADPLMRAVGSLLHERVPREVAPLQDPLPVPEPRRVRAAQLLLDSQPAEDPLPATQLLTNGRHAVVLRSNGAGCSQWDGLDLTRWRDDLLRDASGSFIFLQRVGELQRHSLTSHPAPDPQARYQCRMLADRVVFDARWADLKAETTVWVSPEDDCELRQVTLTNLGPHSLALALHSASEVTLAPRRADESHPAFSNLFIEASWLASEQSLYLRRQPRLADEAGAVAVHFLAETDASVHSVQACTDRARWLGRLGQASAPRGRADALPRPADLATDRAGNDAGAPDPAGTAREQALPGQAMDTGLDPVAVIGLQLRLAPSCSVTLTFCLAAARDLDTLDALVDKYRRRSHVVRASNMSHTMGGIRLRELGFDADTWSALLRVNTLLTSGTTREMPLGDRTPDGPPRCDRRLLWRFGLSGERPIVLVRITREDGIGLVQTLKKAVRGWTGAGQGVDLVVVNGEPPSYLSPVQNQLQALRERLQAQMDGHGLAARRAALHVLREQDLSIDERHTLQQLAALRLHADGRSLAQQVDRVLDDHRREQHTRLSVPQQAVALWLPEVGTRPHGLATTPGNTLPIGQFVDDGAAFRFEVMPRQLPARPWVNVLANAQMGCQVSEAGGGYTWAGNSRLHQITPWANDPLADPAGEWLLLHDAQHGRVWALGRALVQGAAREVTHGIGFTRMRQRLEDLELTLTWCMDEQTSVKQVQVLVRQLSGVRPGLQRPRRLRLVAMNEWVMGAARADRLTLNTRALRIASVSDGAGLPPRAGTLALMATQQDHLGGFGGSSAVLAWRQPARGAAPEPTAGTSPDDWTCDRREFFDQRGQLVLPLRLLNRAGTGLDPCAGLGCTLVLNPAGEAQATLLLAHAAQPDQAQALMAEALLVEPRQRLADQQAQWPRLLGDVQVHSPDPLFDALVNHWLPYQTLGCRMWARAGYYQAGGAFGYRDQLQDALSLVAHAPQLLARQIGIHAARQFPEGDVQHWWHEPGGAGVRTHFSDDLLWLPLAIAVYLQRTGDGALLDQVQPFIEGASVPEGAEDVYEVPRTSAQQATLYEHGARSIDRSLRIGVHGLPLMGTGDWNDGMNRVGHGGRGESVWLAWFLCQVVDLYLPLALARGDMHRVAHWQQARAGWVQALEAHAWDGQWYRRAFFDDGSPLGSAANAEGRIDLIAQAWAVLSGAGDPARAAQAMDSAQALLVDPQAGLVKLLDPPLRHARPSAGYIQAYPAGVRENGGQYNHAGVWALMAMSQLGRHQDAWDLFTCLSPAHRSADAAQAARYGIEPYVMAGDIYTQPPYVGRGGWSWYSGSAGWLLRAGLESICGVVVQAGVLTVRPGLPPHWSQVTVRLRQASGQVTVVVCGHAGVADDWHRQHPQCHRLAVGDALPLDSLPPHALVVVDTAPATTSTSAAAAADVAPLEPAEPLP